MASSELTQLRTTLQELQSYELPANCRLLDEGENDPTKGDQIIYNPHLLQRYKSARNAYIQQATIEKFFSSLSRYDAVANTLPLPNISDEQVESEREGLKRRQQEVLKAVKQTIEEVNGGVEGIKMKWNQFCAKREELTQIVEGMERSERKRRLEEGECDEHANPNSDPNAASVEAGEGRNDMEGTDNATAMDNDEEIITEEDVALEEEKLDELRQRKLALENRLRSVRARILDVEDDCHRTKRTVNEVRVKGGRKPLDWRGLSNNNNDSNNGSGDTNKEAGNNNNDGGDENNVEYISMVAKEVEAEIADMQEKAAGYKQSAEFYDGIRELMEELGGVKILASKSLPSAAAAAAENEEGEQEEGFVLTFMLLGSHILEITLAKNSDSSNGKDGLHVANAKLTTETTFPMLDTTSNNNDTNDNNEETASLMETIHTLSLSNQSFSKIMSQKPSKEVVIPPLDDLVSWSQQSMLQEGDASLGIKFVIGETLARIRTLEARVAELTKLRERYAAQVYDVEYSPDNNEYRHYGGAEQEVVCAIPEGITAALRLGADCPLMPGSVYISEIFGIGGWKEETLEELKKVVVEKRCRGPVEVMECMVKEIRERKGEVGWDVPGTPSLPRGKR